MTLDGRLALVTGGGVRIGRRIVERLAAAGADVVVHHRESHAEARAAVAAVAAAGRRGHIVHSDLADPAAAEALVAAAAAEAGRPIDILVNNASYFTEEKLDQMSFASLEADLRINAWAPFALTRAVASQGVEASVVNLLDSRITDYDWNHVPYILSKKMLFQMMRMQAHRYAPRVRVNAVAPGAILPPPGKGIDSIKDVPRHLPLPRLGTTDEIADAVLHLTTAAYTTGQVLYVDGGRHVKARGA